MGRPGIFLLTRFAVDMSFGNQEAKFASPEWLRERIRLLRTYTTPSVAAQTNKDFTWLLAVDRRLGDDVKEAIVAGSDGLGRIVETEPPSAARPPLAAFHDAMGPWATSATSARLDSDDVLHPTFVERLSRHRSPGTIVSFPAGAIYSPGAGHGSIRLYPGNPFIALNAVDRAHVFDLGDHSRLLPRRLRQFRFVLTRDPMWLQIAHGQNIGNQQAPYFPPIAVRSLNQIFPSLDVDPPVREDIRQRWVRFPFALASKAVRTAWRRIR